MKCLKCLKFWKNEWIYKLWTGIQRLAQITHIVASAVCKCHHFKLSYTFDCRRSAKNRLWSIIYRLAATYYRSCNCNWFLGLSLIRNSYRFDYRQENYRYGTSIQFKSIRIWITCIRLFWHRRQRLAQAPWRWLEREVVMWPLDPPPHMRIAIYCMCVTSTRVPCCERHEVSDRQVSYGILPFLLRILYYFLMNRYLGTSKISIIDKDFLPIHRYGRYRWQPYWFPALCKTIIWVLEHRQLVLQQSKFWWALCDGPFMYC